MPPMLKIPRNRTATMQLTLTLVARGHAYFTKGQVDSGKRERFIAKMHERYQVLATPQKRALLRKKGQASVHLILYPADAKQSAFDWWLLATSGEGEIFDQETMRDARNKSSRLTWGPYELLERQRTGQQGGGRAWTWRRTREDMEAWRALLLQEARHPNPTSIQGALTALSRSPGFAGIREQTRALYHLVQEKTFHQLEYPQLFWVRFLRLYE